MRGVFQFVFFDDDMLQEFGNAFYLEFTAKVYVQSRTPAVFAATLDLLFVDGTRMINQRLPTTASHAPASSDKDVGVGEASGATGTAPPSDFQRPCLRFVLGRVVSD